MLSVGRCDVARLQMKFGYMDGMHCFIDSTSILVKIKSASLYDCRTVYDRLYYHCLTLNSERLFSEVQQLSYTLNMSEIYLVFQMLTMPLTVLLQTIFSIWFLGTRDPI